MRSQKAILVGSMWGIESGGDSDTSGGSGGGSGGGHCDGSGDCSGDGDGDMILRSYFLYGTINNLIT